MMDRSTAIGLVLSYLAAAGISCAHDPAPTTPTPATSPTSPTPVATTAAPVVDAGNPSPSLPDASPEAAVAAADAGKPKKKFPDKCYKDSDCGPDAYCVLVFNGANFEKKPGHCSLEPPMYEGRPLVIDGAAHVATAARPPSALEEHASIAAFARTIASLLALGAPRHLIEKTSQALNDEIRHAAEAWVDTGPGLLPAAIAPFPSFTTLPAELVVDVFRGGCLGETRAAVRALTRGDRAIGEDEARHAALAFETAIWLAENFPEARRALDEELLACDDEELAPLLATLGSRA